MTETPDDPRRADMRASISRSIRRYEHGRQKNHMFWKSIGILGNVGWPIVILTAGGALAGQWLDRLFQTRPAWVLILLFIGATAGSWIAWNNVRSYR